MVTNLQRTKSRFVDISQLASADIAPMRDLAIDGTCRRQGIAMALIDHLQAMAAERGAWVIFVEADYGDVRQSHFIRSWATREDVMHFDIMPTRRKASEKPE